MTGSLGKMNCCVEADRSSNAKASNPASQGIGYLTTKPVADRSGGKTDGGTGKMSLTVKVESSRDGGK